jgi:hypothetical protein
LGPLVESAGKVDEQDRRHRHEAEGGNDQSQSAAIAASCQDPEKDAEKAERDQQVSVGIAGGLHVGGRRSRDARQAGVTRLADLDRPVVEELGGDQADAGGDDYGADRPLGGDGRADPGCPPERRPGCPPYPALADGEAAEEPRRRRPQPRADPNGHSLRLRPRPGGGLQ